MSISTHRPYPAELRCVQDEIEAHALSYGLDFFETVFEVVSYEEMNEIAAYGGFPPAIHTGDSACNMRNFPKGTLTGCKKSMKW